jgi:hypothetical protein
MTVFERPDITAAAGVPGDALAVAVTRRAEAEAAERDVLVAAVAYAAQHRIAGLSEAESVAMVAPVELAGPGAPGVAETAVVQFAAALGMTPDAGRRFLGAALEVAWRLPRTWARVLAGEVPAWRARMIGERTTHLSEGAARYVDRHVAPIADKVGPGRMLRLVEQAMIVAEEPELDRAEETRAGTGVRIQHETTTGTSYLDARLDTADALDLETALRAAAADLKTTTPDLGLDQRRAAALGHIARHYLGTPTTATPDATAAPAPAADAPIVPVGRSVQLYVHYRPGTDHAALGLAELENTHSLIGLDQIATWCQTKGAKVTIRPVIDLNETYTSSGYLPAPRLREQVILRDPVCVHPFCTRRARSADLDHIAPYDPGGPPGQTSSANLAPLCRTHHRHKTFHGWTYRMLEPGHYLWTDPTNRKYLRTPLGTLRL